MVNFVMWCRFSTVSGTYAQKKFWRNAKFFFNAGRKACPVQIATGILNSSKAFLTLAAEIAFFTDFVYEGLRTFETKQPV